ncbi:MAG TPA: histidine kinase [Candidatus Merdivicinus excrementipullorum]|uniref:Histidine kinase n=1 Tax=Candidatus Merdivicinus excrementipullorum TaxID=2840867 RepID=A0A9D1FNU7_9FIRM|nr:histidine kinase [Candidatus Merdivicinus excrementipullorum]
MAELIDNLTQLLAALSGCVLSGVFYLRSRRQPYFLLCCFYGCFGFGLLYWLLYTLLVTGAPPMFYVSDMGWISCFLFLLLLQYSLADKEERTLKSRLPWLALVMEIPLTAYFISIGDVLYNLIVGALMAAMLRLAIRGLVWQSKQPKQDPGKWFFHLVTIGYILLENCLWLSSYPWAGDTLANPYFWFDFAVTVSILALFPAVRKAVKA